jgi:hypothetical protein
VRCGGVPCTFLVFKYLELLLCLIHVGLRSHVFLSWLAFIKSLEVSKVIFRPHFAGSLAAAQLEREIL